MIKILSNQYMPTSVFLGQFGNMVVACDIEFDRNPFGTYFAGQVLSGTVTLKTDKTKDVKAVLLKVCGFAATNWSEKRLGKNKFYNGYEDYMATLTYLLGSEESTEAKCTIPAGTHQYTFACQLPYNCPTSFEGQYGYVRFIVRVVLIRPWTFNETYTRGFTVLRTVDLNHESPQLKIPAHTSNYRTFGCGPCTTEPLKLELSIPQSGFVPGQTIPVNLIVINNTNISVAGVEFSLVMLIRYFSSSPEQQSRVERIAISIEQGESVLRNSTRSLSTNLRVPSTPPSCHNACKFIQIVYHIEVEAKMKGMHPSHTISMPVTIGNVPLWKRVLVTQQPLSNQNHVPIDQIVCSDGTTEESLGQKLISNPLVRSTPNLLYPDLPIPVYEECLHTAHGDLNREENNSLECLDFTPLYPVYNLNEMDKELSVSIEDGGYVNESYIS